MENEPAAPPGDPAGEDEPGDRARLEHYVRKLHTNLGHPENRSLARAIRITGGSDAAIAAALRHHCAVCAKLKEPSTVLPARLNKHTEFGQCVSADTFELADARGTRVLFLNLLDVASRLQLVTPTYGRHPRAIFQRFCEGWASWAGPPERLRVDMGGEFQGEFAEELETFGAQLVPVAAFSPTQNALVERHGGTWKHVV